MTVNLSERETRLLLQKLCIKLGFCLPPAEIEQIVEDPPGEVLAFTDQVFRSEKLDPETADRHLYRRVRDMVAAAFREAEDRDEVARVLREAEEEPEED